MSGLNTTDGLFLALTFIVPGFVLYIVREQFVTGRERQGEWQLVRCLTYSAVNYAVFAAPIYWLLSAEVALWWKAGAWTFVILIGPVVLGLIAGIAVQKDAFRRLLRWVGLNPVHAVPTAWDWKWGRMASGEWVLATLKDGTQFAGFCGANSFISSDPKERDVYIQQVFEIGENDQWIQSERAVLIAPGEVRTIEFWPAKPETKGDENEQRR